MAGEEQGQDVVEDLPVAERASLLVGRGDQRSEHVVVVLAAIAAAGDLRADESLERGPVSSQLCQRRPRPEQHLHRELTRVEAEAALETVGDLGGAPGVGVEPEQGTHGDPHRQVAGPCVEIDGAGRDRQRLACRGRFLIHHLGCGNHPLAMERRHDYSPRDVVVVTVGRQQAVADQRDQVPDAAAAPAEVLAPGNEHEVVGLGADHREVVAERDPHPEDRPVALVALQQQLQRIAPESPAVPDAEPAFTGRERPAAAGPALALELVPEPERAGERRPRTRGADPARARSARSRAGADPFGCAGCSRHVFIRGDPASVLSGRCPPRCEASWGSRGRRLQT